jgi:hypothetical protein
MKQTAKIPPLSAVALALMSITGGAAAQGKGPSSSQPSFVLPSVPGVTVTAIMTVGDSVNKKPDGVTPYVMVGIPDGLGAYDNDDGTFTVLMNHEIPVNVAGGVATPLGEPRAHGNAGAFVSMWTIKKSDLSVLKVEDIIPNTTSIFLSNNNPSTGVAHSGYLAGATTAISRTCSADLAEPSAYRWRDSATRVLYGTSARIYQGGEESGGVATSIVAAGDLGPEREVHFGRQWAFIATDDPNIPGDQARTAYELPHAGLFPWENNLASPFPQRKTIVAGMDDSNPLGQVYFWIGEKQTTGNVVERAGLTRQSANDNLYVVKVDNLTPDASGATNEVATTPLNGTFTLVNEGDVSGLTAAQLEMLSDTSGATQFLRPEDGQWDPNNPADFYFVTTHSVPTATAPGSSRLYRLRFDDITNPVAGGTITAVIDGGGDGTNNGFGTGEMYDNITIDKLGRVILQEDVGNNALQGKVWAHDITSGGTLELARHDAAKFTTGQPGFITEDEETSGVIDVSAILGPGAYLMTDQIHQTIPGELVENGQFQLLRVKATAGLGFDAATNEPAVVALGSERSDVMAVVENAGVFSVLVNGESMPTNDANDPPTKILANGYDARDLLFVSPQINVSAALFGGDGRDLLIGGAGDDLLNGGGGVDVLIGGEGDNTIVQ